MPLLNYSTTVDVYRTLGEIEGKLVAHGARSVMKDYDEGRTPVALSFVIPTAQGDRAYRLPANIDAILKTLVRQRDQGKIERRYVNREQATRVAWRVIKDWLEAELAIVETGMVSFGQLMLPYLLVDAGRTLYEAMEQRGFLLPPGNE